LQRRRKIANYIVNMRQRDGVRLGEVEHLVLLAVWRLDGQAYAVPIRDIIAKDAEIELSRGSIYITLDRLEEKGLVESWFSDPINEPGGKSRRLFRVRPTGVAALRASRRALERLATGTPLARKA
jgi:PadR family transcriptional regulator PadR